MASLDEVAAMWGRMTTVCRRLLSEMSMLEVPEEEIDSLQAQYRRWITAQERKHLVPAWAIPSRDVIARVEADELDGLAKYVSPTERTQAMEAIVGQLHPDVWRRVE